MSTLSKALKPRPHSKRWTQLFDQMLIDRDTLDCITIDKNDKVFFCGKPLRVNQETLFADIEREMSRQSYFPNIYKINDHGNVSLLDSKGNEIASWV